MALVKTIKARNGATVMIYDDCLAKTPEERQKRREIAQKNMNRIYTECMERNWREYRQEHPCGTIDEFLAQIKRQQDEFAQNMGWQ